jgi:hypothetical protein
LTFKDLQKLVQSNAGPSSNLDQGLEKLRGKPFWIFDQQQHKQEDIRTKGDCCFNHIIGLPRKDGVEKPIFDYEELLYRTLLIPGYLNTKTGSSNSTYTNNSVYTVANILHPFKEV